MGINLMYTGPFCYNQITKHIIYSLLSSFYKTIVRVIMNITGFADGWNGAFSRDVPLRFEGISRPLYWHVPGYRYADTPGMGVRT